MKVNYFNMEAGKIYTCCAIDFLNIKYKIDDDAHLLVLKRGVWSKSNLALNTLIDRIEFEEFTEVDAITEYFKKYGIVEGDRVYFLSALTKLGYDWAIFYKNGTTSKRLAARKIKLFVTEDEVIMEIRKLGWRYE